VAPACRELPSGPAVTVGVGVGACWLLLLLLLLIVGLKAE